MKCRQIHRQHEAAPRSRGRDRCGAAYERAGDEAPPRAYAQPVLRVEYQPVERLETTMSDVRWERRGLMHVPVTVDPKPGRPAIPVVGEWTPARLREAHRRHTRGVRSFLVVEGERLYQRERKRAQRAGRMSPVDRAWAEKNAIKSSWIVDERANRRASVTNTIK